MCGIKHGELVTTVLAAWWVGSIVESVECIGNKAQVSILQSTQGL